VIALKQITNAMLAGKWTRTNSASRSSMLTPQIRKRETVRSLENGMKVKVIDLSQEIVADLDSKLAQRKEAAELQALSAMLYFLHSHLPNLNLQLQKLQLPQEANHKITVVVLENQLLQSLPLNHLTLRTSCGLLLLSQFFTTDGQSLRLLF